MKRRRNVPPARPRERGALDCIGLFSVVGTGAGEGPPAPPPKARVSLAPLGKRRSDEYEPANSNCHSNLSRRTSFHVSRGHYHVRNG